MKKELFWVFVICLLLIMPSVFAARVDLTANNLTAIDYGPSGNYGNHWSADNGFDETKMVDLNWNTWSYPIGFYTAYLFLNYSLSNVDIYTGNLTFKAGGVVYNQAIPSECLNWGTLQLEFSLGSFAFNAYCNNNFNSWVNFKSISGMGENSFYEQAVNLTTSDIGPCPPPAVYPVLLNDSFDYYGTLNHCNWNPLPYGLELTPENNQFCYDGSQGSILYYQDFFSTTQQRIISSEFDLNVSWIGVNSGYAEKRLAWNNLHDNGGGSFTIMDTIPGWDLVWYADGSVEGRNLHSHIYAYLPDPETNGSFYYQEICQDCFTLGEMTHYKIMDFNHLASGYTYLDASDNLIHNIPPNSVVLYVNNNGAGYLMPSLGKTYPSADLWVPEGVSWSLAQNKVCIDNELDYAGYPTSPEAVPVNNGTRQIRQSCSQNSDCITQFCQLGICEAKGFNEACSNDVECLSKKCSGGKCDKPSFWQIIDSAKTDLFGNDEISNNAVALLISFVVFVIIFGLSIYLGQMGTGLIVGGGAFIALCIFFTIAGWLSPFILFGEILIIAAVVFLAWLSGSRGS